MSEGLQVIGVGLHRTGSMSVKAALERLGLGPCYHGLEALRRCTDGDRWLTAYQTDGVVDWAQIFDGYRATLDWPTIYFWKQIALTYPNAKVLLTERDPNSWWASHVAMFRLGGEASQHITDEQQGWAEASGFARMQTALATIAPAMFDGRIFDKQHCLRVYQDHYEQVRRTVPAERLLTYRVQDGWEPLCGFLGVAIPAEPFPRVNVGDNLVRNIQLAMRGAKARSEAVDWV